MQPELDALFNAYVQAAFSNPRVLSADGLAALKRAFMAGALQVLTGLPRNELVHTRAEIDRLSAQAQSYLQNAPLPAAAPDADTTELPVVQTDPPATTTGDDSQDPADPPAAA